MGEGQKYIIIKLSDQVTIVFTKNRLSNEKYENKKKSLRFEIPIDNKILLKIIKFERNLFIFKSYISQSIWCTNTILASGC